MGWKSVSGRKYTSRAKLTASCYEERPQKWKEHYKNLLENPQKMSDEPTEND